MIGPRAHPPSPSTAQRRAVPMDDQRCQNRPPGKQASVLIYRGKRDRGV
ncbi:hypothetical protein T261_0593 [Streptomyces lydicus]|nr:hypothetical protein T261_0593 [Streptomyces lydicus]